MSGSDSVIINISSCSYIFKRGDLHGQCCSANIVGTAKLCSMHSGLRKVKERSYTDEARGLMSDYEWDLEAKLQSVK
jgi:hypothetical protein